MSKISYPQLVKNLADAYRVVTGTTDPIFIGELVNKITEAMMNSGGMSVEYKSITYNEDNTITLIDKDDVIHTMVCVYEDDKIVSVTYDGKVVNLTYDDDKLITIGKTTIDIENVPISSSDGGSIEVIPPVYTKPLVVEINSSIEVETSVAIEESGE